MLRHVSLLESGGVTTSRQSWLPVRRRVQFKLSTVVYRSLAGTAPVYPADECSLVTTTGCRSLRSADSQTCVVKTTAMPLPGQHCGTVCLNSYGKRTLLSDSSHDHLKHLCLVSRAAAPWGFVRLVLRQPQIFFTYSFLSSLIKWTMNKSYTVFVRTFQQTVITIHKHPIYGIVVSAQLTLQNVIDFLLVVQKFKWR